MESFQDFQLRNTEAVDINQQNTKYYHLLLCIPKAFGNTF